MSRTGATCIKDQTPKAAEKERDSFSFLTIWVDFVLGMAQSQVPGSSGHCREFPKARDWVQIKNREKLNLACSF